MAIRKYLLTALSLSLILAGSILAEPAAVAPQPAAELRPAVELQQPVAPLPAVDRMTQFEQLHTKWLDATLSGNDADAARFEKDLVGLVSYDILLVQEEVRQLAKEIALNPSVAADQVDDKAIRSLVSDRDIEFEQAIGFLNSKEALYRSVSKSDSFSNRYRLLGDYINLLRRELKMPRLKLAKYDQGLSKNQTDQEPSAPTNK